MKIQSQLFRGSPLIALLALVSVATAAEFKHDVKPSTISKSKAKPGEVVRMTMFSVETEEAVRETVPVVFYEQRRYVAEEFKLTLTAKQWYDVERARFCYLRRTKDGWEFLGTITRQNAKGQWVYDWSQ